MNGIALTSDDRIQHDPLAQIIVSLINAMRADYGQVFVKQFSDDEVLKNFKRRLYQKLRGLPIDTIIAGYESCTERNLKFVPTVPEIVESVLAVVKRDKKRESNKAEAESIAALSKSTITCNPLTLLAEAKAALSTDSQETRAERLNSQAEKLKRHEALLNSFSSSIKRTYAQSEHFCVANGCRKSGALSHGTLGSDNWYCAAHFKAAG